jgi:iron complex outermembrane receptor protein
MNLVKNFELDIGLRWVDSFEYNEVGTPGTVDSYAEMECRLAWRPLSKFEISVTGQNLLHDQHAEYVISSPNPRAEVERSVYGKIVCRF